MGAVKLQFLQEHQGEEMTKLPTLDESTTLDESEKSEYSGDNNNAKVILPQETLLLWVLAGWSWILIWVGWIAPGSTAVVVGVMVNINLIFFFGAPLQALLQVVRTGSSHCIHVPSMVMTVINTSFWLSYGLARKDPVIYVPNSMGLFLGLIQCALCLIYPADYSKEPMSSEDDDGNKEGESQLLLTAQTPSNTHHRHGHRRYYSTGSIRVI
jgi:uncharacterized protein with PQ loop repeat